MNWKDDPLLTDIKLKYKTSTEYINLYRALVKPDEDFKDVNFTLRTPFLVGADLCEYIKLLLAEYFGSVDRGLLMTIKSLEKYTEISFSQVHKAKYRYKQVLTQNKINIVLARVISILCSKNMKESIDIFNEMLGKVELFTGKREKVVLLPMTFSTLLNNRIVYLSGVIAGDGCLSKSRSEIRISDGHSNPQKLSYSKLFIESIKASFNIIFRTNGTITEKDNAVHYYLSSKWLVRFFNHFFSIPYGIKYSALRKPEILTIDTEGLFWRGLLDTDGSIRPKLKGISFVTKSKQLFSGFIQFCTEINIKLIKRIKKNNAYEAYIRSEYYPIFAKYIGFSHTRKLHILLEQLKDGPQYKSWHSVNEDMLDDKGNYDLHLLRFPKRCKEINLPTRPTEEILGVLSYLRPYKDAVYIKLSKGLIKADREKVKKRLIRIEKLFKTHVSTATRAARPNDQYYICSKKLAAFLEQFHKYELPWQPYTEEQIKEVSSTIFNSVT